MLAFVVSTAPVLMPPRAPGFGATLATAAQGPAAVEAALGLDRPTRGLIQQGLQNEGFDPGAPGVAGGARAGRDGVPQRLSEKRGRLTLRSQRCPYEKGPDDGDLRWHTGR